MITGVADWYVSPCIRANCINEIGIIDQFKKLKEYDLKSKFVLETVFKGIVVFTRLFHISPTYTWKRQHFDF